MDLQRYKLLFAFDHDRNLCLLDFLHELDKPPPEAGRRVTHIIAAKHIWYGRISRRPVTTPPWPEWGKKLVREKAHEDYRNWAALLQELQPQDGERIIAYKNLKGERQERPLVTLLDHLLLHGAHHRGQAAMLLSMAGHTPPRLDFAIHEMGK